MTQPSPRRPAVLSYFNLSDEYERKARFIPGVLTILPLVPAGIAFSIPLKDWLTVLVAGVGLSAVIAVGISHLASAMGNRFQRRLWPHWPHDAPTHRWLHSDDNTRSTQQKSQWYAAINRLTNLDIVAAAASDDPSQLELVIDDAVAQLRSSLWRSPHAHRLNVHNADYGFARNLAGLRPLWLTTAALSALGCWIAFVTLDASIVWAIIATLLAVAAAPFGLWVLPPYVRQKADFYAESLFGAALSSDRAAQDAETRDPAAD